MPREFRSAESYKSEIRTRSMVVPFLVKHGFVDAKESRKVSGNAISQTVYATAPGAPGKRKIVARVRLCWRRDRDHPKQRTFSAAQLLARIPKGARWEDVIQDKLDRQRREGVTHLLLVQLDGKSFVFAALIPIDKVLPIWTTQRNVSARILESGAIANRRKKNHAMNGSSPTLWLKDDAAPAVANALWKTVGVIDIAKLPELVSPGITPPAQFAQDDSIDDCPIPDTSLLGSDDAGRVTVQQSGAKRDPRVRAAVAKRANGRCERICCSTVRDYSGFLDVHHILGAAKSDRVYNCVALCPNCHREAHISPDRDALNRDLLAYAKQFLQRGQHLV